MNKQLLLVSLSLLFLHVKAQNRSIHYSVLKPLRPGLAVIIGIISVALSVTFLVLAYAKFCHRNRNDHTERNNQNVLIRSRSRFSGIDRAVIDSLPFFSFSSLKGSKQGLECSVCLSIFEETEVLRLLPKCKHAFHKNCIDQWLESHSSCPLCRYKIDPLNKNFSFSNRDLQLRNPSNLSDDPNLEIFIQREEDDTFCPNSSSRFNNLVSSFRGKQELLLVDQETSDNNYNTQKLLHKFKHKIIITDVIIKNRWSDVNSSDLLSLNTEMLNFISSNRFSPTDSRFYNSTSVEKIKEDILERKRLYDSKICREERSHSFSNSSKIVNNSGEKRSMSEITSCSRFNEVNMKSDKSKEVEIFGRNSENKEERVRRVWLPIVRKTVQWFAGEEKRYIRQTSNV